MSGLLAENRNKYEYFLCQTFHTIPNKTEAHMQTDGKCFPVGCFTILHIYFVNKRGLKSNRLLLFTNSQ